MVKDLFGSLMRALAEGQSAAVVTRLTESGIEKRLLYGSDAADRRELLGLLSAPGTTICGPVSYCAGEETVVVERYAPRPRMLILGGGHIALALSKMAAAVDFQVVVYDDRPAFASPERFPEADEVICEDFSKLFSRVRIRPQDYVVIVTRGHLHDTECLTGVLRGQIPAYMGMIGSRRRVGIVLRELKEQGFEQGYLDQVHTPIGLPIGAVTPAEIAVSILAEVIRVRRQESAAAGEETCDIQTAQWLAQCAEEADALLTVIGTAGSVPREAGAKMAMRYDGPLAGTIGGGCAEGDMMQEARSLIRSGGWAVKQIDLTDAADENGMVCGGTMTILLETISHS
ncbi:MAG: XdhC family protein [Clostridiales Family XIII bacterium]|jgi:xanthine dehydrogenase accessory factor|nr:XdhC family protein [Clostridiales Family XIII bacterium]